MKPAWRNLSIALAILIVVVLYMGMRMGPAVLHGSHMEKFCAGVPEGLDREGLTQMAEQEGYLVTPGHDAKGDLLRIDDDRSGGHYRCEARFKPDGKIDSMNFTAGPKAQVK
jgi:hypothetical protein